MEEILLFLNSKIREEHGNRVALRTMGILEDGTTIERDTLWRDAEVDSFGTTMVFLDMDEKYGCFPKEWFNANQGKWELLTVREVVERVISESTPV